MHDTPRETVLRNLQKAEPGALIIPAWVVHYAKFEKDQRGLDPLITQHVMSVVLKIFTPELYGEENHPATITDETGEVIAAYLTQKDWVREVGVSFPKIDKVFRAMQAWRMIKIEDHGVGKKMTVNWEKIFRHMLVGIPASKSYAIALHHLKPEHTLP